MATTGRPSLSDRAMSDLFSVAGKMTLVTGSN
jgi:hypothetical protein